MTDLQRIYAFGLIVNSALYLAAVFVAGLLTQNAWAWQAAIGTMGVTYLSYAAHLVERPRAARSLASLSILTGVVAGLRLLF